ncbi:histidine kinase dimerization/phosphoacceptor domain -containing protein [Chitinophaga pollutisoli]|uniref:histidine kinase n=1 Tax=Chitinophaga pollutisoli TaxID=3133966 RepID=A0ABZ2YLN6_9BACT
MKTPWRANEVIHLLTPEQRLSIYANLSFHYTYKSAEYAYDLDTALYYGHKALAVPKEEKHPMVTHHAAHAVVTAYIESKQLAKATAFLPEIPADYRARALHQIAYDYVARNDRTAQELDSSAKYAQQSIQVGRELKTTEYEQRNYYILALIELFRKRQDRIKPYLPAMLPEHAGEMAHAVAMWHMTTAINADSARKYAQIALAGFEAARNATNIAQLKKLLKDMDLMQAALSPSRETQVTAFQQFRKYLDLGKQYQKGFPSFDVTQLSISVNYLSNALRIADALKQDSLRIEAWLDLGKSLCMLGDIGKARYYYGLALEKYQGVNNQRKMAEIWAHLGSSIRRQRPLYTHIAEAYHHARIHFAAAGSVENELNFGTEEANYLQEDARPEEATRVLQELSAKHAGKLHAEGYKIYRHLAHLAHFRGDLSSALRHAMTALRLAEERKDTVMANTIRIRLADIHLDLGQHEKSIEHYRQVMYQSRHNYIHFDYYAVIRFTELLIRYCSAAEALEFVQRMYRTQPPVGYYPTHLMHCAAGLAYQALGQMEEAEKQFYASLASVDRIKVGDRFYSIIHFYAGRFFLDQGHYTKASEHLRKAIRFQPDIASIALTNNAHYLLFRCDSAMGNYKEAIGHFQLYKYFTDSLFNVAKSRQISELQIQYETEKKDQELLLQEQEIRYRQQRIQLLTEQRMLLESNFQKADLERQQSIFDAERKGQDLLLKEKDIKLLKNDQAMQAGLLDKERLTRNVTFAGAGLLVIIIGLLINGYRLKQRHNQSLQEKQVEIGQKNASLEKLLTEKEWLLKEIHHRVKNNLQIVMSLLNTQSAYLQNDAALVAIRDSQHRVQAISLIHKKLYLSDNVGLIFMPHYIHELMDYLSECFDAGRRITFRTEVAPLHLDVSQAVPVGLILNEAITNSIKYAFPDQAEGIISIRFGNSDAGEFELEITDNGCGLREDIVPSQSGSLGMSLMEGLSNDVGGTFSISGRNGVTILVRFREEVYQRPELQEIPFSAASQA